VRTSDEQTSLTAMRHCRTVILSASRTDYNSISLRLDVLDENIGVFDRAKCSIDRLS